jgi:hypothetical protein
MTSEERARLIANAKKARDQELARLQKERDAITAQFERARDKLTADRDAGRITSAERSASLRALENERDAGRQEIDQARSAARSTYTSYAEDLSSQLQAASLERKAAEQRQKEEAKIARRNDPEALAAYRAQVAAEQDAFRAQFARDNPTFAAQQQQLEQANTIFDRVANLPPIPAAQAPELTRQSLLSQSNVPRAEAEAEARRVINKYGLQTVTDPETGAPIDPLQYFADIGQRLGVNRIDQQAIGLIGQAGGDPTALAAQRSTGPALLSSLTPTTGPQAMGTQPTGPQGQSFLTGTQPTGTNMVTPLNPATLPPLRGAAAGSSSIDPTLRPYLELGLRGAEQLFLQQQPSLYPGQMFVGPSEQTQAALNMQEDIALAQPTTLQAAQESFMRGLGGIGATAGGAFLGGSPFRQQMIESATRPLMQQFEETTLPGVSSLYSRAGRYGSGAMDRAVGQATEATGRAIGDVASNIAFQDYSAERQRQQQALGLQLQGATLAPQIYGQQFLPSQQLAQVGAARETIASEPLQEDIRRFQFQQEIPYRQLQGFLSSVYGTPLAGSQYQPPAQTNRVGSALGGAALGAGIGQMIGGSFGGFSAPTVGAALGGLGGLLF